MCFDTDMVGLTNVAKTIQKKKNVAKTIQNKALWTDQFFAQKGGSYLLAVSQCWECPHIWRHAITTSIHMEEEVYLNFLPLGLLSHSYPFTPVIGVDIILKWMESPLDRPRFDLSMGRLVVSKSIH